MATNILFVFEGERTEELIINSLLSHLLNENHIVKCVYKAEIYQLFRAIEQDKSLDIFNLIKERNEENRVILKEYNRSHFAEIYLFFDYDAHSILADDANLEEMLALFDDETNEGKLYLSYPMVEAIRHTSFDNFQDLVVKCKGSNCPHIEDCDRRVDCEKEPHYKTRVAEESIPQLNNVKEYNRELWLQVIDAHICKMNYIVNDLFRYPTKLESQANVFANQLNKYIKRDCPQVAVLSAFPIFILDYYGVARTRGIIY